MSSEDTDLLTEWAREHPYVYLLIYKDDQLFFTSDMKDDSEEGGGASPEAGDEGGQAQEKPQLHPWLEYLGFSSIDEFRENREELIDEAEKNGLYQIEMSDGTVLAAVTEFTQDLYYDITNIAAFLVAVLGLIAVLVIYMRRVISKIKRLEADVTIVSHYDMNHTILCEGEDELARLSKNVETMRNSLIENIKREREARSANSELITSVSHDIRTPLTVLLGYIDMMKGRVGEDEVMKSYIAASENTAMRLKNLSDGMFKYALAFGDDETVSVEEYDARTILEQLFSEYVFLLEEEGYDVQISSPADVVSADDKICTDAQNLMRIIDNVFSNIRKYADKSAPVSISVTRDADAVRITITNKISKNPNTAESNGIGLKSATRLAERVAKDFSAKAKGERFAVTLALRISKSKNDK